jgi:hypothetical protein
MIRWLALVPLLGCSSIPIEECDMRCGTTETHEAVLVTCEQVPVTGYSSPEICVTFENARYAQCRSRCM